MKFLKPLQDDFTTLAVRAPEHPPMMYPREYILERTEARRQKEVQGIVDSHTTQEPVFPQLSERLGNPVEGERDSGLKPNTIPL